MGIKMEVIIGFAEILGVVLGVNLDISELLEEKELAVLI